MNSTKKHDEHAPAEFNVRTREVNSRERRPRHPGSNRASSFSTRVASAVGGGSIELRMDSLDGPRVGTCAVPGTGGWQNWVNVSCPVSGATGTRDPYLRFGNGSGNPLNVNWWQFSR